MKLEFMAVLAIAYTTASLISMAGYTIGIMLSRSIFGGFFGWIISTIISIPVMILIFNALAGVLL